MKNLLNKSLFLVILGAGLISCEKEEINEVNYSVDQTSSQIESRYTGVSIKNNMLNFESIDDYYAIVNDENVETRINFGDYAENLPFENYFTEENSRRDQNASQEMDDFFGKLLNQNGCIKIGDHIYRIDLLNEKVLVVEEENYKDLQENLINGTIIRGIDTYTFTQDVISIVNDPDYNGERCTNVGSFDIPSTGKPGTGYEFQTRLKLFTVGIYYRVTGRTIKIGTSTVTYRYKLHVMNSTAEIRRKPCANNEVTSHSVGLKLNTVNNDEAVWEAYSKSWNVKQIYFYIKTYAEFGDPSDDGLLLGESPTIGVNL